MKTISINTFSLSDKFFFSFYLIFLLKVAVVFESLYIINICAKQISVILLDILFLRADELV